MTELYADPSALHSEVQSIAAFGPNEIKGVVKVSFQDAKDLVTQLIHEVPDELDFYQWRELLDLADEIIIQYWLNSLDKICAPCQNSSEDKDCTLCRVYNDIKNIRSVTATELFGRKITS